MIVVAHPGERTCLRCGEVNTEFGEEGFCMVCEDYTEFVATVSYLHSNEYTLATTMEIGYVGEDDDCL